MIERTHGQYTHRHNPRLIAAVLARKKWLFENREEVRRGEKASEGE